MGHVFIDVEISNLEKTKSKKVKALVDTGATLTVIPKKLADELGIKAEKQEEISTGAGKILINRGRGWIKVKEKEDIFPIWVSHVIDKVLLGVIVLEALGFRVDPRTEQIEEVPLLLY